MIDRAVSSNPEVRAMLGRHPRVLDVAHGDPVGLSFAQGDWRREVRIGDASVDQFGLLELMDNNPVVCADVVSVPSPAATLALIALGPIAAAGLIVESPTLITNVPADEADVAVFLSSAGWGGGVALHVEETDLDGVAAATAMVAIRTPEDLDDIDAIYEERFGRSFFVRRDEESEWDPSLVRGTPYGLYRLRIAPDEPQSLLTIRVLADLDGKAGAAQVVHAMNVMAGFEESLGIA